MPVGEDLGAIDGRRARRERNRVAVIDAMLSLLADGEDVPTVEAVAAAADVSPSSVFRYFDNIEDLLQQTVHRYFERYADLFAIPDIGEGDREARIERFVRCRLDLYETIGPIARVARRQAAVHERIAETLAATRRSLADQARTHFGTELTGRRPTDADDVVSLVDSLTSFEAWDLLRSGHERGRRRIHRAWVRGLAAVLSS